MATDELMSSTYNAYEGDSDFPASFLVDLNVTDLGNGCRTGAPPINISGFDSSFMEDLSKMKQTWEDDSAFWPTTITYGVTFTVGVFGNILVMFALLIDPKARNVTSTFLVSLAAADLTFLLICVPYEMVKLTTAWNGGVALCKIAGFVEILTAFGSVLNLTAVSAERYFVIVHPMKSRSWCTMGNTKKIIIAVWVLAILLSAPALEIYETHTWLIYNCKEYIIKMWCADSNFANDISMQAYAWYHMLALFVVPVAIMVFSYSVVIRVLWISTKELAKMTRTEGSEDESKQRLTSPKHRTLRPGKTLITSAIKDHSAEIREARKQVIRMLLTIIAIFFMCWGPRLVLNLMKRHNMKILSAAPAFYVNLIVGLLPYIQSCSNPIIYSFMSKNFRRSMRVGCKIVCRCDPGAHFGKRRPRIDIDLETKNANGTSFSPSRYESRTAGKTYVSVVSEC